MPHGKYWHKDSVESILKATADALETYAENHGQPAQHLLLQYLHDSLDTVAEKEGHNQNPTPLQDPLTVPLHYNEIRLVVERLWREVLKP